MGKIPTLTACLEHGTKEWEWRSNSFSPSFSNLNNLNDDENETKSDFNRNEISIINDILIYLNLEVF